MAKPVINKIIPFDATVNYTLSMSYIGNIPYKNRIIICDARTLQVIFDHTETGSGLEHVIPPNTLSNGNKYAVQGQVIDSYGTESALSDKTYFWTASTPTILFSKCK